MFLKKDKTFLGKNILRFVKQPNGSIAIIVLIIGIAIVLAVGALSAYMIKDIKFTQIDEQKLKALNIAEAGVSNMYSNLYKYYNSGTQLPVSPYTGELKDGTEVLGTYYVEYAPYYTNSILSGYIINSKGVEKKSQTARKVGVKIKIVPPDPSSGIYDYIYTGALSTTFSGDYKVIDGPFYTEGDLYLTAGSAILQESGAGPVVVRRNLYMSGDTTSINSGSLSVGENVVMEGSAKIKGGPVSIGGNLTMSGGTLIGNPLEGPMIIMKDLNMSGSATIGKSGDTLLFSPHRTETYSGDPHIYYTSKNKTNPSYTFLDPMFNVSNLVDSYKTAVQISALKIPGNLTLDDRNVPYNYQDSKGNSLSFVKENGKYILEIHGNVIINGNLQIGVEVWWIPSPINGPSTNEIYYRGKGIIYTAGDIKTLTKLIPLNTNDFPENALLVFISNGKAEFDIWRNYSVQPPSCSSPTMYMVVLAKGNIKITKGVVRGTLIAGGALDVNNSFSKICYDEDISKYIPSELSGSSSGSTDTTFTQVQWQELTP